MCTGISLPREELPGTLFKQHDLSDRITRREAEAPQEVRFLYRDTIALLPAWCDHRLNIYLWGNRDNKKSRLPQTGWCRKESLEEGRWNWLKPQEVEIPAACGLEKGVWFQIMQGIRGVLVKDEKSIPHVYMLTQPSSHYYQTMTKYQRMPILVEQEI